MIEQDLEQKIVKKIRGLQIPKVSVFGSWGDASELVQKTERADQRAFVVVNVPTRGFDDFGICEVSFDIKISVAVRIEMCPTGKELAEVVDPIVKLLTKWNLVEHWEELEDFIVPDFDPAGVQVSQGTGPEIDRNTKIWSNTFNLVLRGTVGCHCLYN